MVSMPRMDLSSFFISYLDEADPRDMRQSKVRGWTCTPSPYPTWMRKGDDSVKRDIYFISC
jgi:hypothetical protein